MSIQIGVIGAGKWGKNILKTLASYPRTIAHIAYGGNEETGRFLQETYSTSAITKDYHEVLANPALEAVFIATPISTHGDIVRDALTAGKHVFVEKPLSTSTEEIATLYTLAEEKNLTLFPGYLYLFDPEFQALQVKTAAPDELSLEMCWEKYGTFDTPLAENLLVHELALAHELIGTLTLESVARNETDVCDITVRGERGTAHIFIDRTPVSYTHLTLPTNREV